MLKKNNSQPIFMVGVPRSGTSILSEAFSMNEKIGWLPIYLSKYPSVMLFCMLNHLTSIPTFGFYFRGKKYQQKRIDLWLRRFLPYSAEVFPFWENILGEKFSWDYLHNKKASRREKDLLPVIITKALKYQGKDRFFAKFTGPSKICYLSSIFSDACYIHVLRDPRAVVSSLLKVKFWIENGGLIKPWWRNGLTDNDLKDWGKYDKSPVALAAIQWRRMVEVTEVEKSKIPPSQFYEIKYENFVLAPHETLQQLFFYFNLNDSKDAHKYISSYGTIHNMNNKFKNHLSLNDISIINEITRNTAGKLGYHLD